MNFGGHIQLQQGLLILRSEKSGNTAHNSGTTKCVPKILKCGFHLSNTTVTSKLGVQACL